MTECSRSSPYNFVLFFAWPKRFHWNETRKRGDKPLENRQKVFGDCNCSEKTTSGLKIKMTNRLFLVGVGGGGDGIEIFTAKPIQKFCPVFRNPNRTFSPSIRVRASILFEFYAIRSECIGDATFRERTKRNCRCEFGRTERTDRGPSDTLRQRRLGRQRTGKKKKQIKIK